jgi:hypothetical protein
MLAAFSVGAGTTIGLALVREFRVFSGKEVSLVHATMQG